MELNNKEILNRLVMHIFSQIFEVDLQFGNGEDVLFSDWLVYENNGQSLVEEYKWWREWNNSWLKVYKYMQMRI